MSRRRILSLWFPRLAAERVLRFERGMIAPFAVVAETANTRYLASLSASAGAAGLHSGQPLRDALALCPGLVTRLADPLAEGAFLSALARWAGRFSPWVAEESPDALVLDLTGCAHLFGGEAALVALVKADCADLGLSLRAGLADTRGAAWALARHGGAATAPALNGDAIDQEARATRSRAARRHGMRGATAAVPAPGSADNPIAPPGQVLGTIAPLPVVALRLAPDTVATLNRLGLRHIGDLAGMSRAALARRFGPEITLRLDQALGHVDEPVSPAACAPRFAMRLTLPEPIGHETDILAGIDRLLPPLAAKLATAGRGARAVRLQILRADHSSQSVTAGLARPTADPARIRPLLALKIATLNAGFGIDALRLEAHVTEPLHPHQQASHVRAPVDDMALSDLISRIGARIGFEAITRLHPADSHVPEKTAHPVAAAWADAATDWPPPPAPRPSVLFHPEPVTALDGARPPVLFRWRRRAFRTVAATGPERIAPEWWLDEPDWRSGARDYWRVETEDGARLWLFHAHGALNPDGWFCQGDFG